MFQIMEPKFSTHECGNLYKILHHLSSSPNPYNPHPRPSLVTWIPMPSFFLSVIWPCAKNPSILMLLNSGITSLRTSSNAILCSPSSQPSVPISASQFHCFAWCLFFQCFWFYLLFLLFLLFWCFWPLFDLLLLQNWVVPGLRVEWSK